VINLDGSLSDCKITHGVPYMDQAILDVLKTWKYTPVIFQGHPQRVEMTIPIRISTPG
jgi:hypothetical protein